MRSAMGINLIFHAVNRFYYGADGFSAWMTDSFKETFFPAQSVYIFSSALPYAEALIGTGLLIGFKTGLGLISGSLLMVLLIAGSCMINQWDWVTYQLIYLICFYLMLKDIDSNIYSVDQLLNK